MPAYVIANVEVTDPEGYADYRPLALGSIEAHGGRYLARGGEVEVKEGGGSWRRVVIVEFPSLERARRWYDSPEYRDARALRQRTARTDLLFVDGIAPAAGISGG
jgi:uncharacterized protein (DUF1330 family)